MLTASDSGDRISKGEKDVPPLMVSGRDEIASVTTSFNRMRVSLAKALYFAIDHNAHGALTLSEDEAREGIQLLNKTACDIEAQKAAAQ